MKGAKPNSMRDQATTIVRRLRDAGFLAFWVGGCVRDFLLGHQPGDYDIATSALPEQIEQVFQHTIPVGRQFGVLVVVEGGHQFQVATFRAEADYEDGRRPKHVTFGDARADALRRDFTINGLFFDPIGKALHDWVGGEADLRAKIIRTIGSPEDRFAEDHLRLLRAIRFAARLGFQIEPQTFAAIQANAKKIRAISVERVREELIQLFQPPHAARGLLLLHQSGLLKHLLPEIEATITCEQSADFHPEGSVFNHLLLMLKKLPAGFHPSLPWAVLFHDVAKPVTASTDPKTGSIHFYGHEHIGAEMAEATLKRLRFPRKEIDDIVKAVRYHMQFKDALQMRKSTLRRLLLRPTFPLELELHRLDCLASHGRLDVYDYLVQQAKELEKKPEIHPPLLKGTDLIAMGMQPGPAMGALLAELREKQLQDELTTSAEAKLWARKQIGSPVKPTSPSRKRRVKR
jgi:poly(A) polymerase